MPHPLTTARKGAKLSQQALADLIGKDRVTVVRIENGQTIPPLATIFDIVSVLKERGIELSADDFPTARKGAPRRRVAA